MRSVTWLLAFLLSLGAACRNSTPVPGQTAPSAESEAAQLVESARREVERETPAPPDTPDRLYVPASASGGQHPLLVLLHGLGDSGASLAAQLELREFAEAHRFSFMAPEGHLDYAGRRFWNASASCCNFDQLEVDHVAQLREWIVTAVKNPAVDPRRVYLVGYSNGGFMAHRAACELSALLRGIFSIAGAGPDDFKTCKPDNKLSVVQIHGDRDAIVSFDGGYLFADQRRPRHPSAEKSVRWWAKFNACAKTASVSRNLDLDPRIPGGETEVLSYPDCAENRVELWRIRGGDHAAGLSRYSLEAIAQFIRASGATGAAKQQ